MKTKLLALVLIAVACLFGTGAFAALPVPDNPMSLELLIAEPADVLEQATFDQDFSIEKAMIIKNIPDTADYIDWSAPNDIVHYMPDAIVMPVNRSPIYWRPVDKVPW